MNATLNLHADEQRIELSGNLSGCGGGSALLIGQAPVRWTSGRLLPLWAADRPLQLKAELDRMQLRPLLRMIPGVYDGSASASGSLRATGKRGQARLDGSVLVRSGEIKIANTGQQLTDVSGRFVFRGNWLQLEQFSARDGEGWLTTSGGIGFQGLSPNSARLALWAEEFPVRREGADLAWLSGGAQLETEIGSNRGENGGLVMLIADRCALGESDMMADADAQQEAMVAGMMGGVLTLGTRGVRNELGGLIPKPILQSRQQAYSGNRVYRVGAGVNADSLIPPFLRGIVRGAYLESAYARTTYSTGAGSERSEGSESGLPPGEEPETGALDFLLELRFPYDLVWTGRIAPPQNWGADILWEP